MIDEEVYAYHPAVLLQMMCDDLVYRYNSYEEACYHASNLTFRFYDEAKIFLDYFDNTYKKSLQLLISKANKNKEYSVLDLGNVLLQHKIIEYLNNYYNNQNKSE